MRIAAPYRRCSAQARKLWFGKAKPSPAGDELICGNQGDDGFFGGTGSDTFLFSRTGTFPNDSVGSEFVFDFAVGEDLISTNTELFGLLADGTATRTLVGNDLTLSFGLIGEMVLYNIGQTVALSDVLINGQSQIQGRHAAQPPPKLWFDPRQHG